MLLAIRLPPTSEGGSTKRRAGAASSGSIEASPKIVLLAPSLKFLAMSMTDLAVACGPGRHADRLVTGLSRADPDGEGELSS